MSWVLRDGRFIVKGGPDDRGPPAARSALPRPMIISDTLADVVNPINGKPYDSKSAYYRDVKAAGCTIMGNDTIEAKDHDEGPPLAEIERDVAQTIERIAPEL